MLGSFANPRKSLAARWRWHPWAAAAAVGVVGALCHAVHAQQPPPPPPGPPWCNPAAWLEITHPAMDPATGRPPVVSGLVTIEAVLHITSGPPGGCQARTYNMCFLECSPGGLLGDPYDWNVMHWEAGIDVPLNPRLVDTTPVCYLHRQVAYRKANYVTFDYYPPGVLPLSVGPLSRALGTASVG